jgi:hypothetical protein
MSPHVSESPAVTDRTLIYPGSEVKALGAGRVAGYLVRFGSPESADVQGDFFGPTTYFGRALKAGLDIVWHHGIGRDQRGSTLRNQVIGDGTLTMKPDGLWIEAGLDMAVKGVPEVYADVETGKVGWSSGSVDRLVRREPVAGKTAVKAWPLIEASLSSTPVDPRNRAIAIKALEEAAPAESWRDSLSRLASDAERFAGQASQRFDNRQAAGRDVAPGDRDAISAAAKSFGELAGLLHRADPEHIDRLKRRLLAERI